MDLLKLQSLILGNLEKFFKQRLKRLHQLEIRELLREKNFHLLLVVCQIDCFRVLDKVFNEAIKVDDDQIFGDDFTRALAKIAIEAGIDEVDLASQAISMIGNSLLQTLPIYDEYTREYTRKYNTLVFEFLINFSEQSGKIRWEKLVRYSKGVETEQWMTRETCEERYVYEYVEDEDEEDEEGID